MPPSIASPCSAAGSAAWRGSAELGKLYKPDETRAWQLYAKDNVVIEYVRNGKHAVWKGFDYRTNQLVTVATMPADAKKLLGL
ncbi:hypothetical protein BH11MYX1_BH11MYX1_23460 [soil metagenome]